MRDLKANSSGWVHKEFPSRRTFGWQTGYGAFAVSFSQIETVKVYFANQAEHHRVRTFQEELRELLTRHQIPFDERFMWD